MLAQHLVLSGKQALDGSHEGATLAGEVADGLAVECGLEEVSRAYAYAQGEGALQGTPGGIVLHSVGGVDASAFEV